MYFNTKIVTQIIGVTARQLGYWDKTGLVKPSIAQAEDRGTRRLYKHAPEIEHPLARNEAGEQNGFSELKLLTDGQTTFVTFKHAGQRPKSDVRCNR